MKITGCVNGLLDNNGRWNTYSYFCQISVKSWKFTHSRFHRLTSHYSKLIQTLKYCRCNNKLRILKIWATWTHTTSNQLKPRKKQSKGFPLTDVHVCVYRFKNCQIHRQQYPCIVGRNFF